MVGHPPLRGAQVRAHRGAPPVVRHVEHPQRGYVDLVRIAELELEAPRVEPVRPRE